MLCRFRPLFVAALALASLGLSACKTIYTDTFSWKKNDFVPPAEKTTDFSKIKAPVEQAPTMVTDPNAAQPAAIADPNAIPGLETPAPAADATMGMPGM